MTWTNANFKNLNICPVQSRPSFFKRTTLCLSISLVDTHECAHWPHNCEHYMLPLVGLATLVRGRELSTLVVILSVCLS